MALFVPLSMQLEIVRGRHWLKSGNNSWLSLIGRLQSGITPAQAEANLNVVFQQAAHADYGAALSSDDRNALRDAHIRVYGGGGGVSDLRGNYRVPLLLLMGLRWIDAADRVHKCRQPPFRAIFHSQQRDCRPPGHRRKSRASIAATSHQAFCYRSLEVLRAPCLQNLGRSPTDWNSWIGHDSSAVSRLACAFIHSHGINGYGNPVRPGSGARDHEGAGLPRTERREPGHPLIIVTICVGQRIDRWSSRTVSTRALRRQPVSAQPEKTNGPGFWLTSRSSDHRSHGPCRCWL